MSANGRSGEGVSGLRVLVTGCSSGFGLLIAVAFARAGHRVFAGVRHPERARDLLDAAAAAGVEVGLVTLDVCDGDSVAAAMAEIATAAGGLDVLVNNAGIEVLGPLERLDDDEIAAQFETNVFGLLRVTRAGLALLTRSNDGVVVNIGSVQGLVARPFAGAYSASKHAVEAISEALHFELGVRGVRVHVLEPGQFPTDLAANARTASAFGTDDEPYRSLAEAVDTRMEALALLGTGSPPDPQVVADTVVAVAQDPSAPLRIPVGADAELILAARGGTSFEDYELAMRTALDLWDGYRRPRPPT